MVSSTISSTLADLFDGHGSCIHATIGALVTVPPAARFVDLTSRQSSVTIIQSVYRRSLKGYSSRVVTGEWSAPQRRSEVLELVLERSTREVGQSSRSLNSTKNGFLRLAQVFVASA